MYKVLICDLKDSRTLKNREEVQISLINAINNCNISFKEFIVCPFRITAGDEWEGLLSINAPINKIVSFFKDHLPKSITFYVGIGEGDLSITNLALPVNLLDGDVFIKARESLKNAKDNNITVHSDNLSYNCTS